MEEEKKIDCLKLEGSHWDERLHCLCLKLCAEMEKLCIVMMRKKPLVEHLKNLWNEKRTRLKIKLM
jgi:hypothetical protein